jgi:hypothetical protein
MSSYLNKLYTAFALACLAVPTVRAQNANSWAVNLSYENDALSMNPRQENYMTTFRGEFQTTTVSTPRFLFLPLRSSNLRSVSVFAFGAYGYTPQNIESSEVETEDRPYGSFAYAAFGSTRYDLEREIVMKSELQVGMLGTGVVENVQQAMNPVFGREVPLGWHRQVAYANSFAFNYSVGITRASFHSGQLFLKYFLNNLHVEHDSVATIDSEFIHVDSLMNDKATMRELSELLVAETGFEFLQTNLRAGVNAGMVLDNIFFTLEMNLFNFNRYSLLNYIPDEVKSYGPLHATHHRHDGKDNFRFNVFVRPTMKLVAYNAMLEGAMFNDNSVLVVPHQDISRVLFEIEAGFNVLVARQFSIQMSWSGRSREYAGGRSFNSWGGLSLGYSPASWNN